MTAPLRIALVGAGSMGSLHARVISSHEATQLVAVVDPNKEVGAPVAERFRTTWVADLDKVKDIDAVVVAAATQHHYEIGKRVLDRQLPLLMEKPLTDTLAHAESLVEVAAAHDTPLMCGLLERYNPGILTAMRLIGAPLHITAQRHSPYVARIRTGVASDLLIHDVDIVIRMMGGEEPARISGSLGFLHPESEPTSEDVAEAMLGFEGGSVANLSASRMSQRKVRGFVINELDRLIEIDMLRNAVTIYRHVLNDNDQDDLSYKQQTIIEIPQLVTSREPLAAQLDQFISLITGSGDIKAERESILPAHRVVELVRDNAKA